MASEVSRDLLAKLKAIDPKRGELGKVLEKNPLETQLLRLSTFSLDRETDQLRAVLDVLGKLRSPTSSIPPEPAAAEGKVAAHDRPAPAPPVKVAPPAKVAPPVRPPAPPAKASTIPPAASPRASKPAAPPQRKNPEVTEASDPRKVAVTLGTTGAEGRMHVMIRRNTLLPVQKSVVLVTSVDNQASVTCIAYEGENETVSENLKLGTMVLDGLAPAPKGTTRVQLTFEMTSPDVLSVSLEDVATKRSKKVELRTSGAP